MDPLARDLFVGVVVFASHFVASVTGFGSAVLALPVLALVLGLDVSRATVLLLGYALSIAITLRRFKSIAMRELAVICLFGVLGMPIGLLLFSRLPKDLLMVLLGLLVLAIAVQSLIRPDLLQNIPRRFSFIFLLGAGAMHGAYAIGGPLAVVYAKRAVPDKRPFRATLAAVGLVLGTALIAQITIAGSWPAGTARVTTLSLPFVAAGLFCGEYIHDRISSESFQKGVNIVLIATGLALLLSAAR